MTTNPPSSALADERFCELPGGMRLCFRTHGDPSGEPLLLIAGLGLQLIAWPESLLQGLAGNGFHVVTFDNRDIGRSTRVHTMPPGLLRLVFGMPAPDNYALEDMAEDTVGLMRELGLERAHIVGMSMGGMIGQTLAARFPQRVRSLTSIFSSTGRRGVGQPAASTLPYLGRPPARTREEAAQRYLKIMRHIGEPETPELAALRRDYAHRAWDRGGGRVDGGVARQIGAILKSGDRTAQLRTITAPTLAIHGDQDRMVHPSGSRATARAIPGALHVILPGMRHEITDAVSPRLVYLITKHARGAG
jgi:pimeloyl-ACP methyl ester carboxylesterase